ncbi:MAG: hypothetical protein P9M03_00630 [Candidatus Theseobacter exili]|nr:hypothetical protein [Candidatus Theseobacter exili]
MSKNINLINTTYKRVALLLIVIGLLLAADSFLRLNFFYKLWPLIVAVLGIGFIGIYLRQKAGGGIYLAVGEYLVCFSGLAIYCNFTSWHDLMFLWPLFIVYLGIVSVTFFFIDKEKHILLLIGLLLVSLGGFFLLIFSVSVQYWWSIFILVGLSFLISGKIK